MGVSRKQDTLDRLVIFLAKRDGIDKLVKTLQYVCKLAYWRLQQEEGGRPSSLADRAKKWEVSCGTSRKAFRSGRFLSGLNALRGTPPAPNLVLQILAILSNGGEMVYFFFDHLLWLSRIGLLDPHLASRLSYVSAFGEAFGYIFFISSDLIHIKNGLLSEKHLLHQLAQLSAKQIIAENGADGQLINDTITENDADGLLIKDTIADKYADRQLIKHITAENDADGQLITEIRAKLRGIRMQRVMLILAIAANLADLVIALAEIEPNPVFNHALTLGISGLVSAWSGWYRNWPSSS